MRLACLLFAGVVLLFASCRTNRLPAPLEQHPYDSLSKYSYLLGSYRKSSFGGPMKPMQKGTGFFYRQNDSLYLISVYHLLSGCPLNSIKEPKFRPDSLDIRVQADPDHYV